MTTLTNWLSPSAMHSLGWTLLHFLWQGTAVAALAVVLMAFCRRASSRYALAVGALVIMLAAPVATFLWLTLSGPAVQANYALVATTQRPAAISRVAARHSSGFSSLKPSLDTLPWLVEAWLLGVAIFSLRSAGGFLLVERERRKQSDTVNASVLTMCQSLQRRLGLDRAIRYCECAWLQAPAVIGWFRPIVLLPVTALTGLSEEQLQLVIVHELAHIQRLDPFVNVFQIAIETLLFYHPGVWWLNQRIRVEREHCCDDVAISLCGNRVEYARALTLMEEWRNAPALAMAANRGPLSERIFRVLGLKSGTRGIGLTGGVVCLTAALIAGNALLGIAYPKPRVLAAQMPPSLFGWGTAATPQTSAAPAAAATPAAKPSAAHPPATAQAATTGSSYIDAMRASGLGDLTVDQLISMKIQGVTPEYVRGLHEQGLHPDVDTIVSMRIQGVTPEYIREVSSLGFNPDADQIVGMKIQGVTPEYVRGLKDAGFQPDADQLISMKIQGVTPEFVRAVHEQGLKPNEDEVISMRVQGVTPEYIRAVRDLGLKPSVDELISMRIQGVTPEYIKGMQAAGFKFNVDELVDAKIQGVNKEFIDRAAKHGFQNLTLEKLIQLKQSGIMDSPGDI